MSLANIAEKKGNSTRWTAERIARLGFLVGVGWEAKRIAADPVIASTPNNVHRQAHRFGLAFRETKIMPLRLSQRTCLNFDKAASKRGVTRERLVQRLVLEIGDDENLIENILDDDGNAT